MVTAVAGAVIGINPFDQPDVEASKVKTRALTDEYEKAGKLPAESPIFHADNIAVYADPRNAGELGQQASLAPLAPSLGSRYVGADFDGAQRRCCGRVCRAAINPYLLVRQGAYNAGIPMVTNVFALCTVAIPRQTFIIKEIKGTR